LFVEPTPDEPTPSAFANEGNVVPAYRVSSLEDGDSEETHPALRYEEKTEEDGDEQGEGYSASGSAGSRSLDEREIERDAAAAESQEVHAEQG
jgi:hypothetical protein